jgi:hypothetical protein
MNESELRRILQNLKRLRLARGRATFWIIKRTGKPGALEYQALFVNTEPHLQRKLAHIVSGVVEAATQVRPYDFFTADQEEDEALGVAVADTDFESIQAQVDQGTAAPKINHPDELNDSWAYLIDVEVGGQHVRAMHKIVGGWSLKKQSLLLRVLFQNATLLDNEDAPVFQLEKKIDFVAFGDALFILDKSKFESVLNFRAGMEQKRDQLVKDFTTLGIVTDPAVVLVAIGDKLSLLRRAAGVKKSGYYQNKGFMDELKTVCEKYGWGIQWQDGRIVVTPQNVATVLTLLNNDRLESPVTEELFDVTVKSKVV